MHFYVQRTVQLLYWAWLFVLYQHGICGEMSFSREVYKALESHTRPNDNF